jgi:hypothetical protein
MRIEGIKSVMSQLFPEKTEDERDPREDQNEENRREAEIKGDKPPHHED